jgi:hypothetical protein
MQNKGNVLASVEDGHYIPQSQCSRIMTILQFLYALP